MEKNDQMFLQLLYIFHSSAMQSMGKVINPITNKVEKDLMQAAGAIDILDVIKEKTKGNLSPDLLKILDGMLSELRLNYVDEMNKQSNVETEKKS